MDKLQAQITNTIVRIQAMERSIAETTNLIRSYTEKADAYTMVTFLPSEVQRLNEKMKELQHLSETIDMLRYLKEEEK